MIPYNWGDPHVDLLGLIQILWNHNSYYSVPHDRFWRETPDKLIVSQCDETILDWSHMLCILQHSYGFNSDLDHMQRSSVRRCELDFPSSCSSICDSGTQFLSVQNTHCAPFHESCISWICDTFFLDIYFDCFRTQSNSVSSTAASW